MPRSDSFGTFGNGSWSRRRIIGPEPVYQFWFEGQSDDPYSGVSIDPQPDWWSTEMDAKGYVDRMIGEQGADCEFLFGNSRKTWRARLEQQANWDRCSLDPEFFVEYYNENLHDPASWAALSRAVRAEYDTDHFICINPSCGRAYFVEGDHPPCSIRQCSNCGSFTSVSAALLAESGPPSACVMGLLTNNVRSIERRQSLNNIIYELERSNEGVTLRYRSQCPYLHVLSDIPQLRTEGNHFIRGRVNREVLSSNGLDLGSSEMIAGLTRISANTVYLIERLLSDESIMLDESLASKFRQEYIDNRWEEEYAAFANLLRENGMLRVDSAGLGDTLASLYNMAQKKTGKKTIIKRDGSIVFPTQEVLEHISQPLIERAFNITEHGRYEDFNEVFRAGGGVGE